MQRRVMSGIKGVYATQVVATAAFEKKSDEWNKGCLCHTGGCYSGI
jgi:hypothetical protein